MDTNDNTINYRRWLLMATAFLIYIYFAREYPHWRTKRLLENTTKENQPKESSKNDDDNDNNSSNSISESPQPSPWPDKFSLRWIPYLPFAVVYLVIKTIISALRLLVLHSLFAAENTAFFVRDTTEDAIQWSVNHGPEFVQEKVITPVQTIATTAWKSPTMASIKSAIINTIIPALLQFAQSFQRNAQIAIEKMFIWAQTQIEPTRIKLEWFAIECVYKPGMAIWARLSILGNAFAQTAKIYLQELAKDAHDLVQVLAKVAVWIWTRTLQPLSTELYALGEKAVDGLSVFLPWLLKNTYKNVLQPTGAVLVDGFHIVRSHPTLLAGIRALTSKLQEKLGAVMERLESVNWLVLLETVLTKAFTTAYHYTVAALSVAWDGTKLFATEIVPNAYNDMKAALDVARPIVAWGVGKLIKVVYPVGRAVYWISWTVAANARPTLLWLNEKVAAPAVKYWQTTIQPGLAYATSVAVGHVKSIADMIVNAAPFISSIAGPVWIVIIKITEVLQELLIKVSSQISEISGDIVVYIKQYGTALGPQIEVIKEQSTQLMDEAVVATSDFMMDWAKKEKRD
ncbi:hypothetical protein BGZ76_003375 [Entomortierella beljakovae]|nr:hypothetical protein BGZ76_003375 [Entomortierella beljakovae]